MKLEKIKVYRIFLFFLSKYLFYGQSYFRGAPLLKSRVQWWKQVVFINKEYKSNMLQFNHFEEHLSNCLRQSKDTSQNRYSGWGWSKQNLFSVHCENCCSVYLMYFRSKNCTVCFINKRDQILAAQLGWSSVYGNIIYLSIYIL